MLFEIVKSHPLSRIIGIFIEVAEPHTAILPRRESDGLHDAASYRKRIWRSNAEV